MLSQATKKDPAMSGQIDYARNEADFYPTPPENVDCLHFAESLLGTTWWECACGKGDVALRVQELTGTFVFATDLHFRGYGDGGVDFLEQEEAPEGVTGIITNPPYGDLAEAFIRKALELMKGRRGKVIMFLRNEYDCGKGRRDLFAKYPFAHKIIVTKRPRWIEGSTGSPRHSYAWYVWDFANDPEGGAYISYVHPDDCPTLRSK